MIDPVKLDTETIRAILPVWRFSQAERAAVIATMETILSLEEPILRTTGQDQPTREV